jgi:hypothetical protein
VIKISRLLFIAFTPVDIDEQGDRDQEEATGTSKVIYDMRETEKVFSY